MKKIFIFLLFFVTSQVLQADIIFNGICNKYQIDVNIKSDRYSDLYCLSPEMLVWDKNDRVYKLVKAVSGKEYTGISIQTLKSNGSHKEEKWLPVDKEKIKYTGSPTKVFLDGLSGLLVGFGFFQIILLVGG
jgi:hypothetical protein